MNGEEKLNKKYKLIVAAMVSVSFILTVLMFWQLLGHNDQNRYFLGVLGMAVLMAFSLVEIVLLLMSLKKYPMIEAVAFDGQNRDRKINKMPVYFVIAFSILSLIGTILTAMFFFLSQDEKVVCMCIIVLPVSFFIFVNTLAYFLCIKIYQVKEMTAEEMINYKG